ncbi:MAG: hypothetical protein COT67_01070 [Candidatus Tagabacteria bacterium CG09_land_8_20_14_0_10_41_14]|uniref:Uncharacterized protein n=1 Tax=Candidatus Tagabacteria bacterium CG09_land_8_20_14_0_10_41_14 TaxID=1975021 RepID=A0A2H0WLM7_9BACT|nr:MAG: hypothetical protein COT67_01070 [Candidatus Tagabacteria bacterium CG09_land_8_20_14_0_10_41_14]
MSIIRFFDKLEDKIRGALSHRPIVYAFIGSVGIILLWRGVWMVADDFDFMTGPVSVVAGIVILLAIGLFVSFFIGDQILISGVKEEKRTDEKTEEEIRSEAVSLRQIRSDLDEIKNQLKKLDKKGKADNVK